MTCGRMSMSRNVATGEKRNWDNRVTDHIVPSGLVPFSTGRMKKKKKKIAVMRIYNRGANEIFMEPSLLNLLP